jgi:hypothetical protein
MGNFRASIYCRGDSCDRLRVYRLTGARRRLIYVDPGFGAQLSFSTIHKAGLMPDLIGDGSRILAYSSALPGVGQKTLVLLRCSGNRLKRIVELPDADFLDVENDGRLEIISRSRPLGMAFQVGCRSFHGMTRDALRTTLYSWSGAKLVPVSSRYPDFFRLRIGKKEASLAGSDPRNTGDFGGYLGAALSVYFDYAEIDRGKEGWDKFRDRFPLRAADPPGVKACIEEMERHLRERLRIPGSW